MIGLMPARNDRSRPCKDGSEVSGDISIISAQAPDAHCCGPYGIAELRLGFGCPRHTWGPM